MKRVANGAPRCPSKVTVWVELTLPNDYPTSRMFSESDESRNSGIVRRTWRIFQNVMDSIQEDGWQ